VKAFQAGVAALASKPDVVVKLDADLSIEPRYFERLMREFAVDHRLGIASGIAYEEENGRWVARHMTRTSVWGACRAYRWECLQDVLPLEARMGWDAVDEFKANIRGWSTRTVPELPFRHHRVEGERDGNRRAVWAIEGETAHYLGYRPSYLLTRSLFRARREPAALAMAGAYLKAVLRREPRCSDRDAVAYLRERQRLRELPSRIAEALGRPVGVS
jgi:hypothetical protein